jgi:hypothetical protein
MPDRESTAISRGRRKLLRTRELDLDKLRLKGHDVQLFERTLEVLKDGLRTMYEHRDIIIGIIRDIDIGRG